MASYDAFRRSDLTRFARRRRALARSIGLALLAAAMPAACAPDASGPAGLTEAGRLYHALRLEQHAVTLSIHPPYDTLRLAATLRSASGAILSDAPPIHFYSTDVDRLEVDDTGLLHAVAVGKWIVVVAVDTVDDIVHADTVTVNVNDVTDPPVLASLSIHPVPPDSAKFALGGSLVEPYATLIARATDALGAEIPIDSLAVYYTSADPLVALPSQNGIIDPYRVGEVTFIASATAYGVTKADTLSYTIGEPLLARIDVQMSVTAEGDTVAVFPPGPTRIAVGGDVIWSNQTTLPVDVTFDDSTSAEQDDEACALNDPWYTVTYCGAGNIAAWTGDPNGDTYLGWRVRQFRVPGTYHYRDSRTGATGTILVE